MRDGPDIISSTGKRKAMEIATLGLRGAGEAVRGQNAGGGRAPGYGVAGPTLLRCRKAEEGLKGCAVADQEAVAAFAKAALDEVNPRSSWRASKEFRLQLIEELAKRAFYEAVRKAGGEVNA